MAHHSDVLDGIRIQYIKLGPSGAWFHQCVEEGSLRLDQREIPHTVGKSGDVEHIRTLLIADGFDPAAATSKAREVISFYDPSPTLWITFADGRLWWCISEGEAVSVTDGKGTRMRCCTISWSDRSLGGEELRINTLSGQLTKTAAYRQSICNVEASNYLIARLRDELLPAVADAKLIEQDYARALEPVIALLTWQDFEAFVELVFAASGWRRLSVVGGTQEMVDIELIQPTTGERALVQVKSSTDQAQLDSYVARFALRTEDRMFYAYHTSAASLASTNDNITLLDRSRLAKMAVYAGLGGWLINKAR
ncbi:MAG: restriction endonuclease [Pseudomonadota bacterium]